MGHHHFVKSGDVFWRKFAQKKLHLYYYADTKKTSLQKINSSMRNNSQAIMLELYRPEILDRQDLRANI